MRKQQFRFSYFWHPKGMKNIMVIMKRPLLVAGTIVNLSLFNIYFSKLLVFINNIKRLDNSKMSLNVNILSYF